MYLALGAGVLVLLNIMIVVRFAMLARSHDETHVEPRS